MEAYAATSRAAPCSRSRKRVNALQPARPFCYRLREGRTFEGYPYLSRRTTGVFLGPGGFEATIGPCMDFGFRLAARARSFDDSPKKAASKGHSQSRWMTWYKRSRASGSCRRHGGR